MERNNYHSIILTRNQKKKQTKEIYETLTKEETAVGLEEKNKGDTTSERQKLSTADISTQTDLTIADLKQEIEDLKIDLRLNEIELRFLRLNYRIDKSTTRRESKGNTSFGKNSLEEPIIFDKSLPQENDTKNDWKCMKSKRRNIKKPSKAKNATFKIKCENKFERLSNTDEDGISQISDSSGYWKISQSCERKTVKSDKKNTRQREITHEPINKKDNLFGQTKDNTSPHKCVRKESKTKTAVKINVNTNESCGFENKFQTKTTNIKQQKPQSNQMTKDQKILKNRSDGEHSQAEIRDNQQSDNTRKIRIISDSHGRNLSSFINNKLDNNYHCQGFIKPNAQNYNILKSAHVAIQGLSYNDYLILIGGTNNVGNGNERFILKDYEEFLKLNIHTNILIFSIPFRYDNPPLNSKISKINENLEKLISMSPHNQLVTFIPLNKLKRHYFTKHGLHFNTKGKKLISDLVVDIVNPKLDHNKTSRPGTLLSKQTKINNGIDHEIKYKKQWDQDFKPVTYTKGYAKHMDTKYNTNLIYLTGKPKKVNIQNKNINGDKLSNYFLGFAQGVKDTT
jgi:hypothetical protein